jgi:unsaturated rhamnogalacturonyl hydrolase
MGWYVMALVDILPYLPKDHPGYSKLLTMLRANLAGLRKVQDPKTGRFYQVLNKGDRPDNWHESSSTGMFIYTMVSAVERKYVDRSYLITARKAWKGLQTMIEKDEKGGPVITEAVRGMEVQKDYAGYIGIPRLRNSTHGLMAIQLAASKME